MALEPGVRLGACGVSLFWCPGSRVRVVRLRAYKGLLITHVSDRLDFIFVSVSSRVSPTNSERTSPLIYLTDPSGLRIVYEQASSWAYPGVPQNPRLLIVSLGATGGRTLLGFGLHLIVSRIQPSFYYCWYCLSLVD